MVQQVLKVTGEDYRSSHVAGKSAPRGNGKMKQLLTRLWKDEEGQDLTEYGLLLVLVALVAISAMKVLAGAIGNAFNNAASSLSSATG
jgi:pilus assembly protein Flp/PilA